eukprot:RCo042429
MHASQRSGHSRDGSAETMVLVVRGRQAITVGSPLGRRGLLAALVNPRTVRQARELAQLPDYGMLPVVSLAEGVPQWFEHCDSLRNITADGVGLGVSADTAFAGALRRSVQANLPGLGPACAVVHPVRPQL